MIRFYLAPYGPGYIPSRPDANASKVIMYLSGNDSHAAVRANPWKAWCLSWVNAVKATHTAIQADAAITLIPLWDSSMEYLPVSAQVSEIVEPYRTQIVTFLENHYIPTEWIIGTATIAQVLRRVIQILLTVQRLKEDYPEYSLETQISAIPAQQRQRILAWMVDHGVETADIDLNWTIRQVLRRIVRDYGWQPIYEFGTALL